MTSPLPKAPWTRMEILGWVVIFALGVLGALFHVRWLLILSAVALLVWLAVLVKTGTRK